MSFQLDPNNSPQGDGGFAPQQSQGAPRRRSRLSRVLNPWTIIGLALALVGGYFIMFVDLSLNEANFLSVDNLLYLGRLALVLLGIYLMVQGYNSQVKKDNSASSQF